jgi:hypothetical protein
MKRLFLFSIVFGLLFGTANAAPPCPDCSHIQAEMVGRIQKLDSVVKLRQSYLLGEIEQSKPAIAACLSENQAITSRAFILWVLGSLSTLGFAFASWRHSRIQGQAIRALSQRVHAVDPSHPADYRPSQTWNRILIGGIVVCFALTQFAALLL